MSGKEEKMKTKKRKIVDLDIDLKNVKRPKSEVNITNCERLIKEEWLAEKEDINLDVSKVLIKLFEEDNTIPFIARYRQHLTENMNPEKLRHVKESIDIVNEIERKTDLLLKNLTKEGPVDENLQKQIFSARNLDEIDLLAASFKKGSKGTLVARAREAGLEAPGLHILNGDNVVHLPDLICDDTPGRESVSKIKTGIKHIIADNFAKNTDVLQYLNELKCKERISLESSLKKKDTPCERYELYKNFNQDIKHIREHQVLAINRAEAQKILNVKIIFPISFWNQLKYHCKSKWLSKGQHFDLRSELFEEALDDAIQRLITPLLTRQIRSNLTEMAERSAISIFASNLKHLLLLPPLRGKVVLAVDPGIKNGCKLAVVSPLGQPLAMEKVFLTDELSRCKSAKKITELLLKHQCETIALGNGTYCRETESFLSKLIQSGKLPNLDVSYTIVDEQGVSIYSCSQAAADEFPNTDPNLISAVSLARRLQDPLAELVKVEPKHLGVGMYQHDIPEKKLTASLDEVVSECVSFVGVDLNVASLHLLRYVAGLTKSRAEAIVSWRGANGLFHSREQLRKVKGIGSKTFQQCAGFLKILESTTCQGSDKALKLNPFDQTEIHPEDYLLAERILKKFKIGVNGVGTPNFIDAVKLFISQNNYQDLADEFRVSEPQIKQLIEALIRPPNHDLRNLSEAPLFRKGITTFESLKPGDCLSGVVRNVVQFGAFVDVGVGHDGLIHSSQLGRDRTKWVQLGDKVEVVVLTVDANAKRLSLRIANEINMNHHK